jgi:molecular chaperone HtpG
VKDEQYADFYQQLTLDVGAPLLHTHLVSDAPVSLKSILYVPSKRDRGLLTTRTDHGLQLYIRNVLIQEHNKDLLPNHFRFVEGVVESEDLPLNISRETVQSSPAARRIRKALARKLLKELETLAKDESEKYAVFWREFGPFIKEGIAADPAAKGELTDLLRFYSSHGGGDLVSLSEYVERMGEEQQAVYYILGEDLRSVALSPHLDYFRAHDIEVLYLVDPIDSFVALALREYGEKPLKNVDAAGLELPQESKTAEEDKDTLPEADFNRVVGRFVRVLGDRVLEVRESKVLRNSPCRLVSPEDAPLGEMSRLYRMLDQDFEVPKRILEINRAHPIVANLARLVAEDVANDVIDPAIEQLFENQLLMEGLHPNPTDMITRIHQLLQEATARKNGS